MKQGECWCNEKEPVGILADGKEKWVYSLDGSNASIMIRISPEQGTVGLPIMFCPYCGRQLADDTPRCPENMTAKVIHEN